MPREKLLEIGPEQAAITDRLNKAMQAAGGQAAVAKLSKVATSSLSGYGQGKEAGFTKMAAIARACGVSLDWLATGIARPDAPAPDSLFSKFGSALDEPAHFWSLLTLIRACREFYEGTSKTPTLAEVFEWIAGPYQTGKELPDGPIEFKEPGSIPRSSQQLTT